MQEEKDLIHRVKKGEMAAFEEIVTAYERKIYNLALRYVGNEQDACDMTQEAFLRIYRSIESFKEESSLSTWIYRITANLCIDFIRKSAARSTVPLDGDDENPEMQIPATDMQCDPEAVFQNRELRDAIESSLAQLSEEHRQIIILRDVSGLTYQEIVDVLGIEEGTVKSRLARARRRLRDILVCQGNVSGVSASKKAEGRVLR